MAGMGASMLRGILSEHVGENCSAIVARNWDISAPTYSSASRSGRRSPDRKALEATLLTERGTHTCTTGPSLDRERSIFSTDYRRTQVIDQGHRTVVGEVAVELSSSRLRLHHYWSRSRKCQQYEPVNRSLLTSRRSFHRFLLSKVRKLPGLRHARALGIAPVAVASMASASMQRPVNSLQTSQKLEAKPSVRPESHERDAVAVAHYNKALVRILGGDLDGAELEITEMAKRSNRYRDVQSAVACNQLAQKVQELRATPDRRVVVNGPPTTLEPSGIRGEEAT